MDAFSTPRNRSKTIIFLAICALSGIAAAVLGIDDNPPGILLAFLAAVSLILAFVHPWRTTREFIFLLLASLFGFVLFIILNIIFDSVLKDPTASPALQDLIQSPAFDLLNLIISMLCPAAFLVGAVGSVAMFIRSRRRPV
jgi:uncharacterized membrane protein